MKNIPYALRVKDILDYLKVLGVQYAIKQGAKGGDVETLWLSKKEIDIAALLEALEKGQGEWSDAQALKALADALVESDDPQYVDAAVACYVKASEKENNLEKRKELKRLAEVAANKQNQLKPISPSQSPDLNQELLQSKFKMYLFLTWLPDEVAAKFKNDISFQKDVERFGVSTNIELQKEIYKKYAGKDLVKTDPVNGKDSLTIIKDCNDGLCAGFAALAGGMRIVESEKEWRELREFISTWEGTLDSLNTKYNNQTGKEMFEIALRKLLLYEDQQDKLQACFKITDKEENVKTILSSLKIAGKFLTLTEFKLLFENDHLKTILAGESLCLVGLLGERAPHAINIFVGKDGDFYFDNSHDKAGSPKKMKDCDELFREFHAAFLRLTKKRNIENIRHSKTIAMKMDIYALSTEIKNSMECSILKPEDVTQDKIFFLAMLSPGKLIMLIDTASKAEDQKLFNAVLGCFKGEKTTLLHLLWLYASPKQREKTGLNSLMVTANTSEPLLNVINECLFIKDQGGKTVFDRLVLCAPDKLGPFIEMMSDQNLSKFTQNLPERGKGLEAILSKMIQYVSSAQLERLSKLDKKWEISKENVFVILQNTSDNQGTVSEVLAKKILDCIKSDEEFIKIGKSLSPTTLRSLLNNAVLPKKLCIILLGNYVGISPENLETLLKKYSNPEQTEPLVRDIIQQDVLRNLLIICDYAKNLEWQIQRQGNQHISTGLWKKEQDPEDTSHQTLKAVTAVKNLLCQLIIDDTVDHKGQLSIHADIIQEDEELKKLLSLLQEENPVLAEKINEAAQNVSLSFSNKRM